MTKSNKFHYKPPIDGNGAIFNRFEWVYFRKHWLSNPVNFWITWHRKNTEDGIREAYQEMLKLMENRYEILRQYFVIERG
jgi:hypothetical protein